MMEWFTTPLSPHTMEVWRIVCIALIVGCAGFIHGWSRGHRAAVAEMTKPKGRVAAEEHCRYRRRLTWKPLRFVRWRGSAYAPTPNEARWQIFLFGVVPLFTLPRARP